MAQYTSTESHNFRESVVSDETEESDFPDDSTHQYKSWFYESRLLVVQAADKRIRAFLDDFSGWIDGGSDEVTMCDEDELAAATEKVSLMLKKIFSWGRKTNLNGMCPKNQVIGRSWSAVCRVFGMMKSHLALFHSEVACSKLRVQNLSRMSCKI